MQLTDAELDELRDRWAGLETALESKLLAAYIAQNTCWNCKADLLCDEHARCIDCPEYDLPPDEP
jgi:hypothetical protein